MVDFWCRFEAVDLVGRDDLFDDEAPGGWVACRRLARGPRAVGSVGMPPGALAHRLMGQWQPSAAFFTQLVSPRHRRRRSIPRPYPLNLASPLDREPRGARPSRCRGSPSGSGTASAPRSSGVAEETFIWSRGEELMTDRFPGAASPGRPAARTAPCSTARSSPMTGLGTPLPFADAPAADRKGAERRVLGAVPVRLAEWLALAQRPDRAQLVEAIAPRLLARRRARRERRGRVDRDAANDDAPPGNDVDLDARQAGGAVAPRHLDVGVEVALGLE